MFSDTIGYFERWIAALHGNPDTHRRAVLPLPKWIQKLDMRGCSSSRTPVLYIRTEYLVFMSAADASAAVWCLSGSDASQIRVPGEQKHQNISNFWRNVLAWSWSHLSDIKHNVYCKQKSHGDFQLSNSIVSLLQCDCHTSSLLLRQHVCFDRVLIQWNLKRDLQWLVHSHTQTYMIMHDLQLSVWLSLRDFPPRHKAPETQMYFSILSTEGQQPSQAACFSAIIMTAMQAKVSFKDAHHICKVTCTVKRGEAERAISPHSKTRVIQRLLVETFTGKLCTPTQ